MRFVSIVTGVLLTLACALAADLQPIPPLATRITDLTGTLNVGQQLTLEAELAALEKRKGSQIGVLIVATTQPEDIEQYAIRVFDAWKLGRMGIDDGILLIVAKDDRRVRIEVARGLEGAIPDATAARIIREYITPKFRAGDFFGGIEAATDVMIRLIDGEQLPAQSSEVYVNLPVFGVVGFFLAFLIRLFFGGAALRIRAPAMAAIFGIAAWQIPANLQPIHDEVLGDSGDLCREHLLAYAFRRHTERVEVLGADAVERGLRYHQATAGGLIHDTRRDVDVNA